MEIRRIELETVDPGALGAFYAETLELPVAERSDGIAVTVGSSRVRFRSVVADPAPYYHFAVNIPENLLDAATSWLEGRCEILRHRGDGDRVFDFRAWNAHSIYFEDPAANILELIARHDLANAADEPFSSEHFLCISEIGLPVADVAATVSALESELNVPQYRPAAKHFAPMGDENGLFIVIGDDRTWLPSERTPARAFPVHVTIAGSPGSLELENGTVRIDVES